MSNVRETVNKLVEAWNKRDWDFIRESLHSETKLVMPDGQEIGGVEACLEEGWKGHADAFPDGRLEVVSAYDDGDVAITEMVLRGTHGGTLAGIAPTQKRISRQLADPLITVGSQHFRVDNADFHTWVWRCGIES